MPSIREVAERSGVSIATVSRVLNGSARVSEATKTRVLEHARALDYAPNAAARTLVRQRSQLIGVVLDTGPEHPDIQHPFFQEVLVGLKHRVGRLDYDLLLFANEEHGYLRRALQHQVDGIVLMGVDTAEDEVARLLAAELPAVGVDLDLDGRRAICVSSDNTGGAALAVQHLAARGHTRIATIAGPSGHKPADERIDGFRAAMAAAGLGAEDELVVEGDFYADSGRTAMRRLLALTDRPTAVFAASDPMAVGAVQAARERGLSVPQDVAVVGFDDIQIAALVDPPLTTVRQDKAGLGAAAGDAIVALVEAHEPASSVTLPVELVVRGSS